MGKFKTWYAVAITLILMGSYYVMSTGAWVEQTPYNVYEDILVMPASLGAARDSTPVWPCDREVTIAVLPGRVSTTPDSFAANKDSVKVNIIARGWAGRNREHCLGQVNLWRPWLVSGGSRTDGSNADSMYTVIDFSRKSLYTITAGTGTWDSARIELTSLKNLTIDAMWPYIDIVIADSSAALCGKNSMYKIRYISYSGNIAP